jgi:hypothetical protein
MKPIVVVAVVSVVLGAWAAHVAGSAAGMSKYEYRIVATNKTGTMQKEMQAAGEAGFRFVAVMGGETAFGGSEVVTVMQRAEGAPARFEYRLLATNKTGTMQKELQAAADAGFRYVGQTVFQSMFGGAEVACILERDPAAPETTKFEYKLLATSKTSTMQKELQAAGDQSYEVVGMTVGQTMMGGSELVTITRRKR